MPLGNNAETEWNGYLVDGMQGRAPEFLKMLAAALQERSLPRVAVTPAKVNMWWRDESPCLDVRSSIDGDVQCTVHAMDYGTSLFVGVAFAPVSKLGNYYKRMAAVAFLESIDRCLDAALRRTASAAGGDVPSITAVGKAGKFGA